MEVLYAQGSFMLLQSCCVDVPLHLYRMLSGASTNGGASTSGGASNVC
jgi:hypothetical protein